MIVVNRFRVPSEEASAFGAVGAELVDILRAKDGARSVELVRNLDDPELWALVGSWADVGTYRRGLGSYETKVLYMQLMPRMLDEPSAYASPDEVGENLPRERY